MPFAKCHRQPRHYRLAFPFDRRLRTTAAPTEVVITHEGNLRAASIFKTEDKPGLLVSAGSLLARRRTLVAKSATPSLRRSPPQVARRIRLALRREEPFASALRMSHSLRARQRILHEDDGPQLEAVTCCLVQGEFRHTRWPLRPVEEATMGRLRFTRRIDEHGNPFVVFTKGAGSFTVPVVEGEGVRRRRASRISSSLLLPYRGARSDQYLLFTRLDKLELRQRILPTVSRGVCR